MAWTSSEFEACVLWLLKSVEITHKCVFYVRQLLKYVTSLSCVWDTCSLAINVFSLVSSQIVNHVYMEAKYVYAVCQILPQNDIRILEATLWNIPLFNFFMDVCVIVSKSFSKQTLPLYMYISALHEENLHFTLGECVLIYLNVKQSVHKSSLATVAYVYMYNKQM